MDKPLPAEKALPSRPVASFINTPSPSKDSRSLLDASEQPLTISVGGSKHSWPTLTPRSNSAPATAMLRDTEIDEPSHRITPVVLSSSAAAMMTAATALTNLIVGRSSSEVERTACYERSSSPVSLTATGSSVRDDSPAKDLYDSNAVRRADEYPTRKASLRRRINSGSFIPSAFGSKGKLSAITDFTNSGDDAAEDSRPHSPSPASFSRPRPSSLLHARSQASLSSATATPITTTARATRAQKTASRIPISDVKKATLVDIKSRRSSGTLTPKSEHAPTFGSRRLDAPDTLKILDQGIKRRQLTQLMRTNTGESTTTTRSSRAQVFSPARTPTLNESRCSSPEGTYGPSSSDEADVVTPTEKLYGSGDGRMKPEASQSSSQTFHHDHAVRLFDGAVSAMSSFPPSTSPFTGPLQTIPSQAALPFRTEEKSMTVHQRQPSDFASMNKRFSNLHAAHADYTAGYIGERATAPESTRYSLMDLLNEYEQEDVRLGEEGCAALDAETRKQITRTLSLLEGNGSLPITEVDNETLLQMFGHLKRGLERAPKMPSFVANAALAQNLLASQPAVPSSQPAAQKNCDYGGTDAQQDTSSHTADCLPILEAVASKWSDSTTSGQASSRAGTSSPTTYPAAARPYQPLPPKRSAPALPQSIGYPSRIPSKANALIGPGASGSATPPPAIRRSISPAIGKRKPGSVRTARETLHQARGGFSRTTASAESKKTMAMPAASVRPLSMTEDGRRGRVPSAEKANSKTDGTAVPKTPRARSKSRYVLDKINGLFSGKREKKFSPAPPVPAIENRFTAGRNIDVTASGSPALKAIRYPSISMNPSISPSNHPAFRNNSRHTSAASAGIPAASFTASEDGQVLLDWTASLIENARRETNLVRRERMLSFVKVLNDSMISAREAQISAEAARRAAKSAQASFEITQKSIAMLQRLGTNLNLSGRF
ncbi:hypothetical protein LTR08_006204 [Meristemomyces frigidus]|nr:hypothetical protein LTR08_006204 [Meristemomyces frigidus]